MLDVISHEEIKEEVKTSGVFFEVIKKANAHNPEWQNDKELQERQLRILAKFEERFPTHEALVDYLAVTCLEDQKSQNDFDTKHRRPKREYSTGSKVRGELFERMVASENDVYDIYSETKHEEKQEKDMIQQLKEEKFIDVFTHPEKYGFPGMGYFNIPDIPFIVTREGEHMVLRAIAEVKSSQHLNARSYQQLLPSGIRKSLEFTLQRLNSLTPEEAYKRGLTGFGKGKEMFMVRNFDQLVVMCRGVDFNNKDFLIAREGLNTQEFFEYKDMLEGRHPESNVTLVNSSFSREEVGAVFQSVVGEVNKRFNAQSHK